MFYRFTLCYAMQRTHARTLVMLSQEPWRQEIRLSVAQDWRELPVWVVHMTIQQLSILLTQMQRMYGKRLGERSEPLRILREAEVMVDNTTMLALNMPATHIPPSVATAIYRATTVLTDSQAAYDQYMLARESHKKVGSMFGELSKAQREAGLSMPFPVSSMPVLMGRRLDSIVGPIVNSLRFATMGASDSGRVSRFAPVVPTAAAASAATSTALVTRVAGGGDLMRAKTGALYHFVNADLVARGISTDRSCVACLFIGRRGPEASGHNFKTCANLPQAWSAASLKGFTP